MKFCNPLIAGLFENPVRHRKKGDLPAFLKIIEAIEEGIKKKGTSYRKVVSA